MASPRPRILVTNDDGIRAPGLLALKNACAEIGDVTVLAPDHNWSASGHVKTMHKPLRVSELTLVDGTPALSTTGAPSDAVALALLGVVEEPIDLVVSGVNRAPTWGTTSPTRAPSPLRWKRRSLGYQPSPSHSTPESMTVTAQLLGLQPCWPGRSSIGVYPKVCSSTSTSRLCRPTNWPASP